MNEHFYSVTRKFIFHQFQALCAMVNLFKSDADIGLQLNTSLRMVNLFKSDADIGLQLNTSLRMVTLRKMNYSESCI